MKRAVACLLAVCMVCCGCAAGQRTEREWFAMDTVMRLTLYEPNEQAADAAQAEIDRIEKQFSVTRAESEIARLNAAGGKAVTVNDETAALLQQALAVARQTNGAFDVTVLPAVKAWGFLGGEHTVPDEQTLAGLRPLINWRKVTVTGNRVQMAAGMGLDLGAIAKGYAADRAAAVLVQKGCGGALLNLGGNVMTVGEKPDGTPFTVGIQDPADASRLLATLSVPGGTAVVTSGDYQRYFEENGRRYHHIMDPRTAAPAANDLAAVTVVASSAALADAMATALFVMGEQAGPAFAAGQTEWQALFVTHSGQVLFTSGLADCMTDRSEDHVFSPIQ